MTSIYDLDEYRWKRGLPTEEDLVIKSEEDDSESDGAVQAAPGDPEEQLDSGWFEPADPREVCHDLEALRVQRSQKRLEDIQSERAQLRIILKQVLHRVGALERQAEALERGQDWQVVKEEEWQRIFPDEEDLVIKETWGDRLRAFLRSFGSKKYEEDMCPS